MVKRALITGIAGQDGSYLAEYLLALGYEVFGIIRRNSVPEHQQTRLSPVLPSIITMYGDLLDVGSIENAMIAARPDEIYNLAAMSHVRISFDIPQFTLQTNGLGVLNVLESARKFAPDAKIYQASSSEMFGNSVDHDGYQRETTVMSPVSPYGCSKVFGYNIMRNYRHSYHMFAANGILFNHESPRRGSNFVSSKIVKTAVMCKLGLTDRLKLGNLDSYRDWGHAYDYVRAMHLILQEEAAGDFVVATGVTHSVRDLCKSVFDRLGLDYQQFVEQDQKFLRPEELQYLRGDSTKIRSALGWQPSYTFERMIDEIVDFWLQELTKR